MKFLAQTLFVVSLFTLPTELALADTYNIAVLQALDKVTARVSTFNAPINATIRFGTLEIIAHICDKRPPEETPESSAFLDISEAQPDEAVVSVYRGWMFASSPALAAMEHPVYDVWMLDCKNASSAETPSLESPGRGP
ncbi:MAG: DUF2155 domain-containing protein [Pseudomonadota bacterium]|nr:DUF2155 domain-containing protein [Pseudomonadota bacterium]